MRSSRTRNLSLAALLVALVAAGSLVPIAYRHRHAPEPETRIAAVPSTAPAPAPQAEAGPPPPGTEVVPPEESESDRGPASATPAGPTLSFARAAGLNRTPDPLHLNSSVALVVDRGTGEVLLRKNDQAVLPIASLTKLMTALLVVEANQPMNQVLTITEEDVDTVRHSRSRLRVGTQLTREEALRLALMSSENRAAHALGRNYPGGLPALVQAMNAKARSLGMKNTTYVDPTGLSNRNQSTARDLAVLVGTVANKPILREFSTTPRHLADFGKRSLQYINSNRLVRNQKSGWDIELQKTGYIVEAGRCLTMLTDVAGHELIMVLLDADSNSARMRDAQRMRRWVVTAWGEPDTAVAQAAEEAAPAKKPAARKKARSKTAVAEKAPTKKSAGKTAVAAGKKEDRKGARVRQSFAAAPGGSRS